MCGGAPKPKAPKRELPPPAPPPELILSGEAAVQQKKRGARKATAAGRGGLVTPGLALGSAAAKSVAKSV
jgi:hypothetical protein